MILELKKIFVCEDEAVSVDYQMDMSDVEVDGGKPFVKPVNVCADIKNSAGVVSLKAKVEFDLYHPCDRCMADVNQSFKYSFVHVLVMEDDDVSSDEYIRVSEYKLDLDKLLRDDIILEIPSKFLCNENCKGICPKCGKNLNKDTCDCVTYHIDPRLEALKKLID